MTRFHSWFELLKFFIRVIFTFAKESRVVSHELLVQLTATLEKHERAQTPFSLLLATCKQSSYVDPSFTEENWPLESEEANKGWRVDVIVLPGIKTGLEGLAKLHAMARRGEIRLIGPRHAMWYIAQNQGVQIERSLVLPVVGRYCSGWALPIFGGVPKSGQRLGLYSLSMDLYYEKIGWLVLRPDVD